MTTAPSVHHIIDDVEVGWNVLRLYTGAPEQELRAALASGDLPAVTVDPSTVRRGDLDAWLVRRFLATSSITDDQVQFLLDMQHAPSTQGR